VGSASLLSLVMRGVACEVIVIDRDKPVRQGWWRIFSMERPYHLQ